MDTTSSIAGALIDARSTAEEHGKLGFVLVLVYIFLEYGRPQSLFPGLETLHISGIIAVLLTIAILRSGYTILTEKTTRLFALLLVFMTIHIPFDTNNYWAYQTSRIMLLIFIAYLGILAFVNSFSRFMILINVWLVIHVFLAIYSITHGGRGTGGFLGDENDLSMTLGMALPFAFFLAITSRTVGRKLLYFFMSLLYLAANVVTLSRGGFLGLTAAGFYCWLMSPRKVLSAIFVVAMAALVTIYAPDRYWDEIRSIKQEGASQGTGAARMYAWKVGWHMFLDNPLVGVGPGNFPFEFRKYEISSGSEGFHGVSRAGHVAHSIYFTLFPELGLVGAVLFGLIIRQFYKTAWRIRVLSKTVAALLAREASTLHNMSLAAEASLVAYLVSSVFITTLYYPNFWLLMGFILVIDTTCRQMEGMIRLPMRP